MKSSIELQIELKDALSKLEKLMRDPEPTKEKAAWGCVVELRASQLLQALEREFLAVSGESKTNNEI